MKHENVNIGARVTRVSGPQRLRTLIVLLAGSALTASLLPYTARAADSKLVVVDVVAVAEGYRASKLTGTNVLGPDNKSIGELDDLVIGKTDRVMFAIIQVGGFLGLGSKLVAVPYTSLQISGDGRRIVLPGATKDSLKNLPEFKYRA
jgi:sporulation protein YlmC with PRC-barrel domain